MTLKSRSLADVAVLITLLAVVSSSGLAGFASAQTPLQKRILIDLTSLIDGKKFTDGTHLIKTLDTGERISITTKDDRIVEIVFADLQGREQKKKLVVQDDKVARDFTVQENLPPPKTGHHWECTSVEGTSKDGNTVTFNEVCTQVQDRHDGGGLINPFPDPPKKKKP